ncbi:MAG: alpha/beta hydrolase [Ilumatobacteraceae bacterium]
MMIQTADSTRLAVADWGTGRPVVLVHAWGLNSHMWNAQLPVLLAAGLRCVTIDLRGHGRSDRPTTGYDLDTMANDVGCVLDALDLADVVLVGQSMAGAICTRLVGGLGTGLGIGLGGTGLGTGLGTDRVTRLILSAPVTPCLTTGPDNELGLPAAMFVANRVAMAADIAGWLEANRAGYWGTGPDRWPAHTDWTTRTIYETPLPILLATNEAITSADLRADVAAIRCPTLVMQGDADRSAPIEITGRPTAALLQDGELHVITGAGHGLYTSFAEQYCAELVRFAG